MDDGSRPHRSMPLASTVVRFGFAFAAAVVALLAMIAVTDGLEVPVYSILVGGVGLAAWYGGVSAGLFSVAVAWTAAAVLVVGDRRQIGMTASEAWVDWGISLAVAVGVVWLSVVMRRERAHATQAADVARESVAGLETLQALSSALSAAATMSDVVSTLVEAAPPVVGAPLALGFVEEGEIVIAQPEGAALEAWQVLKLTEGRMLHRTATQGRPLIAVGRDELEATFPDTARLAPRAQAAVAVPLRVEDRVIGSIGFVFDQEENVDDDSVTLALVVAGLGGQALERARLYEREQESRRGLDRILRVAPRFFSGSETMITDAICREARTMFGADLAMLWRVAGDTLELIAFDPEIEPLQTGLDARLGDFPRLKGAVDSLNISFVPDVRREARGEGLERVRLLGIRSSLRIPVAIAGKSQLVLVTSWQTPVTRPDASTLVLVRRFADQAGLALEQIERRRAQAEATRRAVEARRLHEMTAALAHAATPADVGAVCLEHTRAVVGSDRGVVVRAPADGMAPEVVASAGQSGVDGTDLSPEVWDGLDRALATGEPVWEVDRRATNTPRSGEDEGAWAVLPLRTASRVLGALYLTLGDKRGLTAETRARLDSVVAQCALALERSFLLDSEYRLRRRSERLQEITVSLSNALTRSEVANALLSQVDDAVGTECAVLASVGDQAQLTELLGWSGYDDEVAERWLSASLEAETPQGQALRRLDPQLFDATVETGVARDVFDPASTGHTSFLFVPLVLRRRPIALLVASSREPLPVGADDLRLVGALAGQAAQALDRARRFESEQTIAETLQQSVLPSSLPDVAGVQLAGRYLPGTAELEVGGDWYDAILLPNGRLGLVAGDVVGKGVRAAATMGQLRNAIRAFSLDRLKPASTLARLSRLTEEVIETSFATLVYAELDPETGVCRYASAGHPPPLAVFLDGRVEYLEGGRGLPLGTGMASRYRQGVLEVPHGGVLLFYTDGLIERRGRSLDEGLERLRAAAASGPRDPERLIDHVLEHLIGEAARRDDVALLAARLLPVAPRRLDLRLERGDASLRHSREALRLWLAGASPSEMEAHDIVLAVWEACANASEHGVSDSGFRLRAELIHGSVKVVVDDGGAWVPPSDRSDRGRGLELMRSLMSSVEIEPGDRGTRVILEKRLVPLAEPSLTKAR
jgi:serine phosphatase RsbU (regulator of sigma subunit)/anti-sigma regulatory factor (Ser/Thr protein kinase)